MTFHSAAWECHPFSDRTGKLRNPFSFCAYFLKTMTVADLPYHRIQVDSETFGYDVAHRFENDKALPGIIVSGPGRHFNMVVRNHFYQRLGRLYGIEIFMPRPISFFLENVSDRPLTLDHSINVVNAVVTCLARGESVYDPFLVIMPDEEPRLVTFQSLILKQTELLSVAQVEAQAQKTRAIEASNTKSEFLAVMSHELRTPLTAIIGYGEIIMEDAAAGNLNEVAPRVQNIVSAGLHLLEMINGILDLAKVEAGKTEMVLEIFRIPDFLEGLTGTVMPLVERNQNEFRLIIEKGLGEIICDKTKLKQCLLNLLGNASKFTQKGCISLRVSQERYGGGLWAIFEIADTGIGMTDVQMQKLFQPFYQADSSISRRFGGTGLGLSLTKRYCEMMGGTLSVRSVLDKGSTFTMRIPMAPEQTGGSDRGRGTKKIPLIKESKKRRKESVRP
jgi:signal transduction histidine kinase